MKSKAGILLSIISLVILVQKPKTSLQENTYLPLVTESSKKCWALSSRQAMQPLDIEILQPSCFLSWKIAPDNRGLPIQHINMFWCNDEESWQQLRLYIPIDSASILLFLNEPDLSSQCNITPQEAVATFNQIRSEYPNLCISAPQVSHIDYQNNWQWLREYLSSISEKPCFGTIHTYLNESPNLIVESYLNIFPTNEIWITEFGQFGYENVRNMIEYYEFNNLITKYFYYAPRNVPTAQFVGDTYELTPMGEAWIVP